jgi:1,2-diacylglycerol 3-alpha-glucosyltransferase
MNVCMFTNTYLPHVGGVARSVQAFSADLERLGHRVLIVAPEFSGGGEADDQGPRVLRVPAIQNFNGSDFSVRIAVPFLIRKAVDRFEPDIIHSHHPFLLGDAALRVARRRKNPLVFTHHTLYERYTHYVPMDSPGMKRFVINLSTRYANMCHAVVAPSRSVSALIRERGVETPVTEIPTGVDPAFFASGRGDRFRSKHGIPEDAVVLGHLGRLAPEKNLEYLAEAAVSCMKGKEELWFLVVGDGPSREGIRGLFRDRGLSSRLVAPGSLSGSALADAYAAMDLFVFSSTSETQGMVLVEAMAAETPVIALDASGSREVVKDTENGRLLPADTPAGEFARAVLEFLGDPALMEHARRRALKTARSLSREACAARLVSLYESTLSMKEAGEPGGQEGSLDPWELLLESIKAEWDLISGKTTAVVDSIRPQAAGDPEIP